MVVGSRQKGRGALNAHACAARVELQTCALRTYARAARARLSLLACDRSVRAPRALLSLMLTCTPSHAHIPPPAARGCEARCEKYDLQAEENFSRPRPFRDLAL